MRSSNPLAGVVPQVVHPVHGGETTVTEPIEKIEGEVALDTYVKAQSPAPEVVQRSRNWRTACGAWLTRLVTQKKAQANRCVPRASYCHVKTGAATKFPSVPPAATSRESSSLDYGTVDDTRDFATAEECRGGVGATLLQRGGGDSSQ